MDMLHYQVEADTRTEYFGISLRSIKIIFIFIIESLKSFYSGFWFLIRFCETIEVHKTLDRQVDVVGFHLF